MLHEKKRTYSFPKDNGDWAQVIIRNVVEVKVSKSGGHRVTKNNGGLVYIPSGWLCISIESDYGWEQ